MSFHVKSRALRPVSARIVSYGRTSKVEDHSIAKNTTLYVMRVTRSGSEWYVARRYSEFRALHDTLRTVLARPHGGRRAGQIRRRTRHRTRMPSAEDLWTPTSSMSTTPTRHTRPVKPSMCVQCRELAAYFGTVQFPRRFRLRSGLSLAKDKIESARMQQLNEFLQLVIDTTQGLLANEDDDDDDEEDEEELVEEYASMSDDEDDRRLEEEEEEHRHRESVVEASGAREERCDALAVVRAFLMVQKNEAQPQPQQQRLAVRGSSVCTFRMQEMDVMYSRQSSSSPSATWAFPPLDAAASHSPDVLDTGDDLDDVFLDDYASPTEDTLVHCRSTDDLIHRHSASRMSQHQLHPLRRVEGIRLIGRM